MAARRQTHIDPNLNLPEGFKQIAQEQASQTQGVQNFGAAQDQNIQSIYGQLKGGLQQGASNVQSIYGNASSNIQSAYDRASTGSTAAAASGMGAIGQFAETLGMDSKALAEVQGRLASQAQTFDLRNRQSAAGRISTVSQLGAGMANVAQLGVQAAEKAEAQGRSDLSRRIQMELQKISTSAASARTGFTRVKADQSARAADEAQKGILQAAKELAAEQRIAAREARADARSAASSARADARAARSSSGRSSGRGSSGPDWMTKFMLQNEENDRRHQRGRGWRGISATISIGSRMYSSGWMT